MASKKPAQRKPRPKLDPRLTLLLELDEKSRSDLQSGERSRIETIGKELKEASETLATLPEKERAAAIQRIQTLYGGLFAPISAGLLARDGALPESLRDVGEPVFSAFILADTTPEHLGNLGVRVRSQAGDVFTAFVPQSAFAGLENAEEVHYVELARSVFPTGDAVMPAAQQAPRTSRRASAKANGKGTIVGVIDSTLDLYHSDFRKRQGNSTRVLSLWDQTLTPVAGENPPAIGSGFGYGVEYTQAQINQQLFAYPMTPAYQKVRHNAAGEVGSHGTAVTGLAAGNGQADPFCEGSAPEADIIFVAQSNPHAASALADNVQVMDAFSYIFAQAEALGRPCVVNLSNGDNLGSHDGTSMGERFLDALLEKPGRAITLSAGNSTGTACHATGKLAQGNSTILRVNCDGQAKLSDALEIWYDGADLIDVTIGAQGLESPLTVAPGEAATAFTEGGVQIVVDSMKVLSDSNRVSVIFLVPNGSTMPQGVMTLELRATQVAGSGTFHAWIDRNNRLHDPVTKKDVPHVVFTTNVDDTSLTLGTPGTARHAITVGNHDQQKPPKLAGTSGLGPTRDGRVKPELAARGEQMDAPWSWNRGNLNLVPPVQYATLSGTSASAPFVAGVCACLFEDHGLNLTWAHLKQLLAGTVGTKNLVIPDRGFGFGYLQIDPLIGSQDPAVDVWIKDDLADTGKEPNVAAVTWASPDIEILDLSRAPVANPSRSASGAATNIVRVRVRNRGKQVALNTQVHLAWAEGTTHVPMGPAWKTAGLFVPAAGGAFTKPGSVQAIASLPPGLFSVVEFGFAPPPGTADRPLTLIVRLDNNLGDPWPAVVQPWALLGTRNNLAMRTILVVPAAAPAPWTMSFDLASGLTGEADGLEVTSELGGGQVVLRLNSTTVLPPARRGQITGAIVGGIKDIPGAVELTMGPGPLYIPRLALAGNLPVQASISVTGAPALAAPRRVHVAQRSGGQVVGGVTLEIRP